MIADFYDKTVVIKQVTNTQTGMGGNKRDFSTRIASLPCRIDTKNASEIDQHGRRSYFQIYRIYCDASSVNKNIAVSDRAIFGTQIFKVTGVRNPGMQDHHLEIDMEEVT